MTNTQDIIDKLDQALMCLEAGNIEACEAIGEAILMIERERMERKRAQFLLKQQAVKSEDVIFLRKQAS